MIEKRRCGWSVSDPIYMEYHDLEWGVPVRDDRKQFEFLVLESAQAGLSWLTILYAHLQATGLVNNHLVDCFRHRECMDQ